MQRTALSDEQGRAKLREQGLPFSQLPGQSRLFLEYLQDPVSLRKYFPNAVASYSDVSAFVPDVLAGYSTDRNALCDALTQINTQIGAGERTFENIGLLRNEDTVAVVTGQQAGLFTGPLYTIYKALSAIKMAEYLNVNGKKAAPVFWVATEDHDFEEVSRAFVLGDSGQLIETRYEPGGYVKGSAVGSVEIDSLIVDSIDGMLTMMSQTEFSADVRNSVGRAWKDGTCFGNAFAANLAEILGKYGLIFVDPMHAEIKSLVSPIYREAIEKSNEIVAAIRERSTDLDNSGYHAQVMVEEDYFPLFWHEDDGRRSALRKKNGGKYGAKGSEREFDLAELKAIADGEPQRFSPGVMLRPVVQDYLLPTVCYFGGAAEIAYFAQNSEAYRILERPVTPIFHRQSFTVVEAKHRRTLDKFGLEFSDLFSGYERVVERIGKRHISSEMASLFIEVEGRISAELDRLGENLSLIDPALVENLAKRRRKIIYHIAALNKRAHFASIRKDETIERRTRSAFDALLPKGQLQERIVNVHSFLNKHGAYFIDLIYQAIDLNDKDHRVVDL